MIFTCYNLNQLQMAKGPELKFWPLFAFKGRKPV